MNLTDFLLARIAEDEEEARSVVSREVVVLDRLSAEPERGWSYDPSRVLAECETKWRIVGLYVGPTEDDEGNLSAIGGYGEAWLDALRLLALPYAGHPDYQQEWKP